MRIFFLNKAQFYMEKLIEANENDFFNYLHRHYFQSKERMSMWAHCYRVNAGINTNMALESMNNFLKTNQMRHSNICVEKLLDLLEKLVDLKMWQRILKMERPTSNTYQDKIVMKEHKLATKESLTGVSEVSCGNFRVKCSTGKVAYSVCYNKGVRMSAECYIVELARSVCIGIDVSVLTIQLEVCYVSMSIWCVCMSGLGILILF